MTLKEFLEEKKLDKNILEVQVIKLTSANKFIVGDTSSLAILDLTENPLHIKGKY